MSALKYVVCEVKRAFLLIQIPYILSKLEVGANKNPFFFNFLLFFFLLSSCLELPFVTFYTLLLGYIPEKTIFIATHMYLSCFFLLSSSESKVVKLTLTQSRTWRKKMKRMWILIFFCTHTHTRLGEKGRLFVMKAAAWQSLHLF